MCCFLSSVFSFPSTSGYLCLHYCQCGHSSPCCFLLLLLPRLNAFSLFLCVSFSFLIVFNPFIAVTHLFILLCVIPFASFHCFFSLSVFVPISLFLSFILSSQSFIRLIYVSILFPLLYVVSFVSSQCFCFFPQCFRSTSTHCSGNIYSRF